MDPGFRRESAVVRFHRGRVGRPAGDEAGGATDKGDFATIGQARAHADHILLGDADIEKAFRELVAETTEIGRTDAVVADRDNAWIRLGKFDERLGEGLTAIERFSLRGS